MNDFVTLIMAVMFLWAGVVCIHRPQRVQQWLVGFYMQNKPNSTAPGWMQSCTLVYFIRVVGLLCMVNFISQLYLLMHPMSVPTAQ